MTQYSDVVVVGAGLFGCIMAKALRKKGYMVNVVDKRYKEAGSIPAACLIKPTWISGLGKDITEPAMAMLRDLYQVQDLSFQVGPAKQPVWWINPADILHGSVINDEVIGLDLNEERGTARVIGLQETYEAKHVVLAAGVWTDKLVPEGFTKTGVEGKAGVAFLFPHAKIEQPFIAPWAPFKQTVAFNRGDGMWVSDGTAIKPENLTQERIDESFTRCWNSVMGLGLDLTDVKSLYGIRPYLSKSKPCYFKVESSLLTVVTGGAKNGTLAAGWAAHKLMEHM